MKTSPTAQSARSHRAAGSDSQHRRPSNAPGHLADAVALITGAGRGIGRATAELFAREGARVALCSRTRRELQDTVAAIRAAGGTVVGRVADIGSIRQVRAVVRMAVQRFGRVDILINNAGILGPRRSLTAYPIEQWLEVIRINLTGTFYISREVARVMAKQRSGCIISVSSSVGRAGRAEWGAYAVSKFGTEGLSQVLAHELKPFGICVVTLNPGATRTAMRAEAHPEEDPRRLPAASRPADALLRLALCQGPAISGKAFDMNDIPGFRSLASR